LFLNGLKKYGKGDWRSISRNCVVTRTPSQVASHAQKYFLRLQNSSNTEHKQWYSSTSRHRRRNSSSSSTTDKAAASMAAAPSPHLSVPASISNEFAATPFSHFSSD
jgi:SHAQKYF class myb-like DNA-binding protein